MTNKEALQALLDGKKIRKPLWEKGRYLCFDGNTDSIRDEENNYRDFHCSKGDWEIYGEPILDDEEKAYLEAVIKPFRDRVICIAKCTVLGGDATSYYSALAIQILVNSYNNKSEQLITFPYFPCSSFMYKNMEFNKKYTLKELGL